MEQGRSGTIRYSIFDPTGNITALVGDPVPVPQQPSVAAEIMRLHPAVEQVGFVRFPRPSETGALPELRMAGGEFCGNASMCAAALYAATLWQAGEREPELVSLRVSGTDKPVEVNLSREDAARWSAGVMFPPALSVGSMELEWNGLRASLPLIRMEGITHLAIETGSPFFPLKDDREAAGQAVKTWCGACRAPGLGLMFLAAADGAFHLTPLVYIPGSDTLFWENSCASGSAAVGMLLAERSGRAVDLTLTEPGGTLRVACDPLSGETRLFGRTVFLEQHILQSR
ncbi:MAG: hypothetical protein IJQ02_15795 [Oscillospiraceae bacterium]|nr:hypothetical protein [Oscillospiraceae bacterium]